jgi:hypothetical protein
MKRTIESVIQDFRDFSPCLYDIAMRVITGDNVADGEYNSQYTDNNAWNSCHYFTVKNGEITRVGEETTMADGIYWTSK